MKFIFRLILLAAIIYAGWYVWKNYQVEDWFAKCKPQIEAAKIEKCFIWPQPR